MSKTAKNNNFIVNIGEPEKPQFFETKASTSAETTGRGGRQRYDETRNVLKNDFMHIDELPTPFSKYKNYISIKDTLELVEKAYWNFHLLWNMVETSVELSNTEIYLQGSNKVARTFIEKWLSKIKIANLADQWFRDWFLKHNVYAYRQDAIFKDADLTKLNQVYGLDKKFTAIASAKVPIRYLFLDPALVVTENGLDFDGKYHKLLTKNEIDRLKNPKTDEDKEFLSSFTAEEQKAIKNGVAFSVLLEPDKLYPAHRKKQDYQPFAVPFAFTVLKDIDYKLLLKKLDREIAKTFDIAILHLTVGYENKEGKVLINNDNIRYLRELFQNPKLQRVLTTDFTVKGEWLVPPMDKLLGKEKYEEVDNDLKSALFGAFFSDTEKFASVSIKVKVFIEKLKEARRAFVDNFLEPEIKRVCKEVGFKSWPKPKFIDLDLQDEITLRKIYARMAEIGFLTPQELQKAIESGVLPEKIESEENQREFKKLKEEGLYSPALNQKSQDAGGANGRPSGTTGVPQTSKKVKPIGTKASFSLKKIIETTKAANAIQFDIAKALKKKLGAKKMTEEIMGSAKTLCESIVINEPKTDWEKSIDSYLENPKPINEEVKAKLIELQDSFDVDESLAILLEASNKE